jgi:hypothetical protein
VGVVGWRRRGGWLWGGHDLYLLVVLICEVG